MIVVRQNCYSSVTDKAKEVWGNIKGRFSKKDAPVEVEEEEVGKIAKMLNSGKDYWKGASTGKKVALVAVPAAALAGATAAGVYAAKRRKARKAEEEA